MIMKLLSVIFILNRIYMQSLFFIYFKLGVEHILNIAAIDHILFIIGISVVYSLKEWTKVVYLISAFTLGHFISLAITLYFEQSIIPSDFIEMAILVTILLVAYANFFIAESKTDFLMKSKYWFSAFFGVIHGLGFSNYLRSLLLNDELGMSLLAFNVGVELGQLCIVTIVLMMGYLVVDKFGMNHRAWQRITSVFIFVVTISLLLNTFRNV